MHWRLRPAQTRRLRGVMELFLFRGGYGGLSLVEGRYCESLPCGAAQHACVAGGWTRICWPRCERRVRAWRCDLQGAERCGSGRWRFRRFRMGILARQRMALWRVGDQAAVIPSFTGDGMSIALHSAILATDMYLCGEGADEYVRRLTGQLRAGMRFASGLSRAMVTPAARTIAPFLLSLVPNALGRIATSTRIPDRALLTARVTDYARVIRRPAPIA